MELELISHAFIPIKSNGVILVKTYKLRGNMDGLIMTGWDYVWQLRPSTGLLFLPRMICEHGEPWWWWFRLEITPDSSTRALLQSYQQRHLGKVGGMYEGVQLFRVCSVDFWMKKAASRDIVPRSFVGVNTRVGSVYSFHRQGDECSTRLHRAITRKDAIFTQATVGTWNLTIYWIINK
jgi:hypothetical protein